jgi:hypothetical protein
VWTARFYAFGAIRSQLVLTGSEPTVKTVDAGERRI